MITVILGIWLLIYIADKLDKINKLEEKNLVLQNANDIWHKRFYDVIIDLDKFDEFKGLSTDEKLEKLKNK